jgi:hypothetical protein
MESERDPVQGETPEERARSAREHAQGHRSEAPSSQAEIGAELNEYQADVSERAADAQEDARGGEEVPEGTARENPARERTSLDHDLDPPEDPLLRREESAAAAEAGAIGGPAPDYEVDEEHRPLEEGGEGVAEGFEESERELIETGSHGDPRFSPDANAPEAEVESDLSTAAYGEPDEVDPTELVVDPEEGEDDPGAGPGLAHDR